MKKTCVLVLTVLMAASLAMAIWFMTLPVYSLEVGAADENGWVQNANMEPLAVNDEGATVITTTAGGVPTYNTTALDVTKDNYITFRTTGSSWLGVYLVDDTANVLSGGNLYQPKVSEGAGLAAGAVRISAILDTGMQLGYGYSEEGMINGDVGAPSDISQYTTIKYHIGTGGEDASYMEINGTRVVGQNQAALSVTQADFKDGKAYVVFQTLGTRTVCAMAPNEDPVMLEGVELLPMGFGGGAYAGFMLSKSIPSVPDGGYQITAENGVNNVLVNGQPISSVNATLNVVELPYNDTTIQAIGLLPADGGAFSWKAGDVITFLEGFTVYDSAGAALWDLKREFGFYIPSVADDGTCSFAAQIGLTNVGADGNFVNMNTSYNVSAGEAKEYNVGSITINGDPLTDLGYFNVALPNTVQILKTEGNWEWSEGDVILLPYGFTFKDAAGNTYALDANYTLTYGASGFVLTKTEAGESRPVGVSGMQYGNFDAASNLYGMQIIFNTEVRGDIVANTDVAAEAWLNAFIEVNGRTLADIRQIKVGTDAEDKPIYATVRAIFEKEDAVTIWVDGRAGVVASGGNKLGKGAVVTILPGLEFPSGYITTEEQSFEWTGEVWTPTVALDQFELNVENGQKLEGGIEQGTKNAFVNIPASLSSLTSIPSFPIQDSADVKEYVMVNGQLLSQMASSAPIIQVNNADVLQVQLPQGQWTVGDRVVLMKGMPLFSDIPTKPNTQVAELAHYYILDCTSTDGRVVITVTVTDTYEADEDIELGFAGMQQFTYDQERDAYGFNLTFTKNVRGDAYELFTDLTGEDWIRNFITVNGKTVEQLLAATDAEGNPIPNAVQIFFGDNKYLSIYVSAKIPVAQGGVVDADGNVIETVRVAVADGFTVPRDDGVIAQGVKYKYEYNFWCRDVDLSTVEYDSLAVTTVNNPVSVDADGNIAFKVYFDKNVTDTQYQHINAGAEWLSGVSLGYTAATIERLASYGFIRDCLTKIEFNGMTIEELMNTEKDPAFRPVNVVMVHYDKNEIQIVFRTTSVNTNDETFGKPAPYAINLGDPDPHWTLTFREGFTVPTLCKLDRDYTFTYNKDEGRFVETVEEEVISDIVFEAVAYDGVMIEEGGTLDLTGVTELDKNLFTIAFEGGINPEWTIEGNALKEGANTVTLVAQTTDGSGKTVSFTFTVNVRAGQTPAEPNAPSDNAGLIIGLSVGGAVVVVAAAAVAVVLIRKKKSSK